MFKGFLTLEMILKYSCSSDWSGSDGSLINEFICRKYFSNIIDSSFVIPASLMGILHILV